MFLPINYLFPFLQVCNVLLGSASMYVRGSTIASAGKVNGLVMESVRATAVSSRPCTPILNTPMEIPATPQSVPLTAVRQRNLGELESRAVVLLKRWPGVSRVFQMFACILVNWSVRSWLQKWEICFERTGVWSFKAEISTSGETQGIQRQLKTERRKFYVTFLGSKVMSYKFSLLMLGLSSSFASIYLSLRA